MQKMITVSLSLCIISLLSLIGCSQAGNEQLHINNNIQLINKKEQSWQQVTVKYYNLEGGLYGLITQSGNKLLPLNLAKKYQLSGTILKVKGQIMHDTMTIQQWGQAFKITTVELVKLGRGKESNQRLE